MTVDPTLAALSDHLFSVTVALYSLAVVAFCAQLAFGRRPARVRQRQLVGAGAPVDESVPEDDRAPLRPAGDGASSRSA